MGSLLLLGAGGKGAGVADVTAPTITSSATVGNVENNLLAHTLTADETVTWSIVGGADAAKFEISGSTLRWLGNGIKDFEAPDDANTDNAYLVTVRATDAVLLTTDQAITVTVTDVADFVPWSLVASWTHSGNVANVDFTGLAGYSEVRVLLRLVSATAVGLRQLLVSTDNGSSFLSTSGDYILVDSAGTETNQSNVEMHTGTSSAALSSEIIISGWNATSIKLVQRRGVTANVSYLIPVASALNALRIQASLGNLSSGSIYVWAR